MDPLPPHAAIRRSVCVFSQRPSVQDSNIFVAWRRSTRSRSCGKYVPARPAHRRPPQHKTHAKAYAFSVFRVRLPVICRTSVPPPQEPSRPSLGDSTPLRIFVCTATISPVCWPRCLVLRCGWTCLEYNHLSSRFLLFVVCWGGVVACVHHEDDAVGNKTNASEMCVPL